MGYVASLVYFGWSFRALRYGHSLLAGVIFGDCLVFRVGYAVSWFESIRIFRGLFGTVD